MDGRTDQNYIGAWIQKKNFHYILANFGWILKLDKIGKFLLMIDFVDAHLAGLLRDKTMVKK